jgi:L,D-peptidoglycan transpeptidase YkuD (ErfK/YbiS/YcfS/YnhG family)
VFLHLARPNYAPTAGCVSMSKAAMLQLLRRLSRKTKIVIG